MAVGHGPELRLRFGNINSGPGKLLRNGRLEDPDVPLGNNRIFHLVGRIEQRGPQPVIAANVRHCNPARNDILRKRLDPARDDSGKIVAFVSIDDLHAGKEGCRRVRIVEEMKREVDLLSRAEIAVPDIHAHGPG